MPSGRAPRRAAPRDPRELLARLVDRLGERFQYVTFEEIERAATRPSARLPADTNLAALVEAAVAESLLLKDLRSFFDRTDGSFTDRWVYRVNARHPLVATLLSGGEA